MQLNQIVQNIQIHKNFDLNAKSTSLTINWINNFEILKLKI